MKLNPKKCTFEAVEGMFMGHAISKDGIQACSEKTQAVIDMPSPQTLKEVQSLNGKLTSLNRFLSKSAENSLPFFKILKRCIKKSDFAWTKEVEKALKDMKKQMAELPTLTTPIEGETLIMYLSVAKINNLYHAKEETMQLYLRKAKDLTTCFRSFSITQVLVEIIPCKSIEGVEVMEIVEEGGDTWMTPIIEYLENGSLPEEKGKARRTSQLCDSRNTQGLLQHALRSPISCDKSNAVRILLADNAHGRPNGDQSISGVSSAQTHTAFGLSGEIISDNRKQFRDGPFRTWCEKLNITQHFAYFKHPQSNQLVERANRSLGEGIKARLGKDNKYWVEELPHVLWAHRTMIKSSNRNTPFSLTYGTEAVIPVEIGMPCLRCSMIDKSKNDEGLLLNLELLKEKRELAAIAKEKHKRKMEMYYNLKVWSIVLNPGDLVYRSNKANKKEDTGKLGPKWEVPYEVIEALGDGAYRLRDQEGKELPRTWNIAGLKRCYI
ncbi:reverse transcriptase domain-containing protein [Tanacetum coccineum]